MKIILLIKLMGKILRDLFDFNAKYVSNNSETILSVYRMKDCSIKLTFALVYSISDLALIQRK
jgi:hypothetical protein